jgi:cytochrome c peroxidase
MLATLADVVAFYNRGGGNDTNKDPRIKQLGLSSEERANLVAFLESLSGDALTGPEHVWKDKINVNYVAIQDWLQKKN